VNNTNVLLQKSLTCKVVTPLNSGESITNLCIAIRKFMPENFMAAMATSSACIMGANYMAILSMFGCCGVPMLTGHPESCNQRLQSVLWLCMVHMKLIHVITKLLHHTCSKQQATLFVLMTLVKRQLTPGKN